MVFRTKKYYNTSVSDLFQCELKPGITTFSTYQSLTACCGCGYIRCSIGWSSSYHMVVFVSANQAVSTCTFI